MKVLKNVCHIMALICFLVATSVGPIMLSNGLPSHDGFFLVFRSCVYLSFVVLVIFGWSIIFALLLKPVLRIMGRGNK